MIICLEHANVRVVSIARTIAFYADVLGMRAGPVPGQSEITDSAWIYAGDGRAVLHIGEGALALSGSNAAPGRGAGAIDHITFECDDDAAFRAQLEQRGVSHRVNDVAAIGLRQIFVTDPDGICLELNFRAR